MSPSVHGIHHVTCICGDAQENLNFYVGVMGMRLVKRSVNQDAIDTYHLFYADGAGTPGTDLTFFPWPQMAPARSGVGLAVEVTLAVPPDGLPYWRERLEGRGVSCGPTEHRFGERSMAFRDPHGLALALVETAEDREFVPWDNSPVPPERQVRGIHSARIRVADGQPTEELLTRVMGLAPAGEDGGWRRYGAAGGGSGRWIEVQEVPGEARGRWGTGGIHHVAWRTKDEDEEMAVRARVEAAGLRPTGLIDRFWFKSVYFREPGGVLFELATDGPGFAVDEDPERLGEQLILPPWLEPHRRQIESALPPLELPRPR